MRAAPYLVTWDCTVGMSPDSPWVGWLPPNQSHEGPDKDLLARRLSDDDSVRPLVGDVRVVVSAAENKRNCAFVQALTNDSAITITEFDVENSRGKISILDDP